MRTIKFRAWDKKRSQFVDEGEVAFCFYGDTRLEVRPNSLSYTHDYCQEEYDVLNGRFIVMQFTGLKDKNGKECYESDLVKSGEWTYKVIWKDLGWEFDLVSKNWSPKMYFDSKDFEIVGNIYEN